MKNQRIQTANATKPPTKRGGKRTGSGRKKISEDEIKRRKLEKGVEATIRPNINKHIWKEFKIVKELLQAKSGNKHTDDDALLELIECYKYTLQMHSSISLPPSVPCSEASEHATKLIGTTIERQKLTSQINQLEIDKKALQHFNSEANEKVFFLKNQLCTISSNQQIMLNDYRMELEKSESKLNYLQQ